MENIDELKNRQIKLEESHEHLAETLGKIQGSIEASAKTQAKIEETLEKLTTALTNMEILDFRVSAVEKKTGRLEGYLLTAAATILGAVGLAVLGLVIK